MIEAIHQRMLEAIRAAGGEIVAVRYCPHMPEEGCLCRKPAPGMLRDLASEWQIDTTQAYMVGDALSDIAAGQAVGSTTVLVRSGRGAAQIALLGQAGPRPDYIAADLRDAADWITARGT
jgi:D-glycero-D-manno-heptose 1,7-bisphosphate phosphatase